MMMKCDELVVSLMYILLHTLCRISNGKKESFLMYGFTIYYLCTLYTDTQSHQTHRIYTKQIGFPSCHLYVTLSSTKLK